tara:strand:+ start:142 stop:294 length:153 start_codon:yes stop_codon:yes gene_type:complete
MVKRGVMIESFWDITKMFTIYTIKDFLISCFMAIKVANYTVHSSDFNSSK